VAFAWDLYIDGKEYNLQIDEMPNGKDSVRVNGRIVAKPMEKDEQECRISIGGRPHIITRSGDSYLVSEDQTAMAAERNRELGRMALARTRETPLPMMKSSGVKPMMIIWIVAVLAIGGLFLYAVTASSTTKVARNRVQLMLNEMKSGKDVEMQFAIGYWAMNQRVLDNATMSWASDKFDKWRREGDFYGKAFSNIEIVDAEELKGEQNPTVLVTFKVDGAQYKVRVPKGQPISWAN